MTGQAHRSSLPIDAALPELFRALTQHGRAVLQAPPGAGKTTRVPLALLEHGLVEGQIVMLEPRRLAARASAERMAETLGEPVGQTVGYRIRGDAKSGKGTRIEVVTEGILTRRMQRDPGLSGVGLIIFDEFHERSLQADLGLALAWEVRSALREDLNILVMSATLDAEPVARLLDDAPVVSSEGRAFPVETRWLPRPRDRVSTLEREVAALVTTAAKECEGGILVFLPGEAEIRRTASALEPLLPENCRVLPLFGAMPPAAQRAALAPGGAVRKVVLATSIAETSLTIDGIRVVVDAGLTRRAQFDPGSGMTRLVTERVSHAEANQRRGRAGRVAPGQCYRMWTKGEDGGLRPYPPTEMETADLTGLALELAQWGATPDDLAFLTAPPEGAFAEARSLLRDLTALDAHDRITAHGKAMAALPVHPRLAHMLIVAGPDAADFAALLNDRDPMRDAGADIELRLKALRRTGAAGEPVSKEALARIRKEARRIRSLVPAPNQTMTPAEMAALAYPDRIALRRPGNEPRWLLSGGKGAIMRPTDPLAGQRMLVVTDLDGDKTNARIRRAISISESDVRGLFADEIRTVRHCGWSKRDRRVEARLQEQLGAIVLSDQHWRDVPDADRAAAALDGLRTLGLSALKPSASFDRLRARIALVRGSDPAFPDPSQEALLETSEDWLLPSLYTVRTATDFGSIDPYSPFEAWIGWDRMRTLDHLAPPAYVTPLQRKIPVDYGEEQPGISVRLQEMFGETRHPTVGGKALRITLLSPAGRPVQTTTDLPGFWAGSYSDVRKDMRSRYPKHPWPEDPTAANPTLRAKPRR